MTLHLSTSFYTFSVNKTAYLLTTFYTFVIEPRSFLIWQVNYAIRWQQQNTNGHETAAKKRRLTEKVDTRMLEAVKRTATDPIYYLLDLLLQSYSFFISPAESNLEFESNVVAVFHKS
ncbi:hypothetical protein ACJX0J_013397, partial [Zea mays]